MFVTNMIDLTLSIILKEIFVAESFTVVKQPDSVPIQVEIVFQQPLNPAEGLGVALLHHEDPVHGQALEQVPLAQRYYPHHN